MGERNMSDIITWEAYTGIFGGIIGGESIIFTDTQFKAFSGVGRGDGTYVVTGRRCRLSEIDVSYGVTVAGITEEEFRVNY